MPPRRPLHAEATDDDTAAPVTGETVTLEAVVPSKSERAKERATRIARTGVQVSVPAAIVGIASWLARLNHLDLDPGAGIDLPADVAGYFVAVLATIGAWAMNRKPKDDE